MKIQFLSYTVTQLHRQTKMKKIFILLSALAAEFLVFSLLIVLLIFPQGDYYKNERVLDTFAEMIGEENYAEFTEEYNIIFMDELPLADEDTYGDIFPFWGQVRIRNSTDEKMLISLCHEYGHYVTLRDNLTVDEYYISLYEEHEPIYSGRCNLSPLAYQNMDEFCACVVGAGYYNAEYMKAGKEK